MNPENFSISSLFFKEYKISLKGGQGEKAMYTRMLQKPRMLQIRGGKGEGVLRYCEPLPTKEMWHHTAFPKGKK
jgi:hypothetical protein